MPASGDNLNQNLALRYFGNLHRTVLIRFEIHFRKLVMMQDPTLCVKADINAGVSDWLIGIGPDVDSQFRHGPSGGLVLIGLVRRAALAFGVGGRRIAALGE